MEGQATGWFEVARVAWDGNHRGEVQLYAWAGVVLLLLLFARIAARFSRLESSDDYLLMGRGVGFWLFFGAYTGASIGGASVAGFTGMGFEEGMSPMWLLVFSSFTVPVFAWLFAPALNRFGRAHNAFTVADFLVHRFGPSLRVPTMVATYLRPVFITAMQFLAVGLLLRVGFGLGHTTGVLCGAGIVLLYTFVGGQFSAMTSQWLQSLLQGLGMFLFLFVVVRMHGGTAEAVAALREHLPSSFLNAWNRDFGIFSVWVISMGIFELVDPWLFQWAYMARDGRTSRNALIAASIASPWGAVSFLGGMLLAAGVASGRLVFAPDASGAVPTGDSIYLAFLQNHLGVGLAAFLLVAFLMTVLSCASSFLMNAATIFQADLLVPAVGEERASRHPILLGRLAVGATGVVAITCALWVPSLVDLWVLGQSMVASGLLWPVLAAWFWPRATANAAFASMVGGGLSAFVWALVVWSVEGSANAMLYGWHAVHVGLSVGLVLLLAMSMFGRHAPAESVDATSWRRWSRPGSGEVRS